MFAARLTLLLGLLLPVLPVSSVPPPLTDIEHLVVSGPDLGPNWSVVPGSARHRTTSGHEAYEVAYENGLDYSPPRRATFSVTLYPNPQAADESLAAYSPWDWPVSARLGDGLVLHGTVAPIGPTSPQRDESVARYSFRVAAVVASAEVRADRIRGEEQLQIRQVDDLAWQFAKLQEQHLRAVLPPAPAAKRPESILELGTLGGSMSIGNGINNRGQVVGESATADGQLRAFLWTDGQMLDLGSLDDLGLPASIGVAVNDTGQVVGVAAASSSCVGGCLMRPFLWQDGIISDLPLPNGFILAWASDINATGQVAGSAMAENGRTRAVLWRDGSPIELGTLDELHSGANAINASGQIVGAMQQAIPCADACHARPFVWDAGALSELSGVPNRPRTYMVDINDVGHMVGYAEGPEGGTYSSSAVPFLHKDGEIQNLSTLGGPRAQPRSLNNRGQVAGWAQRADLVRHAVVWQDGAILDLNEQLPPDSTWILEEASAINDAGQVTGSGYLDGQRRAFLATMPPGAARRPRQ